MKATSTIIWETVTEAFTSKMVDTIKDNGKMIKCTDLVNFIIKMEKLHMKDIGNMINSMGKEESTTQNLSPLMDSLTTKIFLS